jgi:hypothetical protein
MCIDRIDFITPLVVKSVEVSIIIKVLTAVKVHVNDYRPQLNISTIIENHDNILKSVFKK